MRLGIFADIHGNIYAFEKVIQSLLRENLDAYIFCGDICGYYYYQNEVINILREIKNLIAVAGNHDEIFLKIIGDHNLEHDYCKKYGRSYALLKANITPENLLYLKNLPQKYIIDEYNFAVFHGSPWDYMNEYVYATDPMDRFLELPYQFVFLGHTHCTMDKNQNGIRIINPGSCGQPRDYNRPCYAIFDLKRRKAIFKRVEYDQNLMINDVIRYKEENSYLIEVLQRENFLHG